MRRKFTWTRINGAALPLAIGTVGIISIFIYIILSVTKANITLRAGINSNKLLYAYNDQALSEAIEIDEVDGKIVHANKFQTNFQKANYGLFETIRLITRSEDDSLDRWILLGDRLDTNLPQIWVPDRNQEIRILGDGVIEGNFVIPSKGFSKSSIYNTSFNGQLIAHSIKNSSAFLPELDKAKKREIQKLFESKKNGLEQDLPILYSADSILIFPEDDLANNSIVIAPKIILKRGVKKSLQLFAKDTIIIEENVELHYPSTIAIFQEYLNERNASSLLRIHSGSKMVGTILVLYDQKNYRNMPRIELLNDTEFYGQIFNEGSSRIEGKLFGSICTTQFHGEIDGKEVINLIYNGSISPIPKETQKILLPRILEKSQKAIPKSIMLL